MRKCHQLQRGLRSPDPGLCPWTPLRAPPPNPHYIISPPSWRSGSALERNCYDYFQYFLFPTSQRLHICNIFASTITK